MLKIKKINLEFSGSNITFESEKELQLGQLVHIIRPKTTSEENYTFLRIASIEIDNEVKYKAVDITQRGHSLRKWKLTELKGLKALELTDEALSRKADRWCD